MGLGEVELAVKSFQKAVHLNPDDQDLRKDDLEWALSILKKRDEKLTGEMAEKDLVPSQSDKKDNFVKLRS